MLSETVPIRTIGDLRRETHHLPDETPLEVEVDHERGLEPIGVYTTAPRHGERIVVIVTGM